MAHASTSLNETQRGFFSSMINGIWNMMMVIGESNSMTRRIAELQDLTDEQLAQRGLKREDIVRHVCAHWL